MAERTRVAVLISGGGSNMAALIDAAQASDASFEIVLVVSNNPDAVGLALARSKGIKAVAIDHHPFVKNRELHEREIDAVLAEAGVQVVALAGYMRVLTPWLVGRWSGRMLNIHPSLLPEYTGLHTHARAIEAGDAEAGCTVHLVTDGVDEGPILGQARVAVLADDTPETLAQRVLVAEHALYSATLATFCEQQNGVSRS